MHRSDPDAVSPARWRVIADRAKVAFRGAALSDPPLSKVRRRTVYERFGKRGFDVLAALVGLILAAPIMALVALAIRLETSGPVFFWQERLGRHQQRFTVIKFRTMRDRPPQAIDQRTEGILASDRDSRITRVGRLLRRLSVDELPQIWNVLRGEMSLVGPRPILPEQLEAIGADCMDRFTVRPGITGLAQISGRRTLSWPQQLRHDVDYARNVSLAWDVSILLRTIGVVWAGTGVYGTEDDNWRRYIRKQSCDS